jgi:PIN domain nuclease of toxin-antitoxin system
LNLLLDTHVLLWAVAGTKRLPTSAKRLLNDPLHQLVFSAVSMWEVAIKAQLGKPGFQFDPRLVRRALLQAGYLELALTGEHALAVAGLPPIHKDPFDRILIAQCSVEGYTLVTADPVIAQYPGGVIAV